MIHKFVRREPVVRPEMVRLVREFEGSRIQMAKCTMKNPEFFCFNINSSLMSAAWLIHLNSLVIL